MKFGIGLRLSLLVAVLVLVAAVYVGYKTLDNTSDVLLQHELLDLGNDTTLEGRRLVRPIRQMRDDLLSVAIRPSTFGVAAGGTRATPEAHDDLVADLAARMASSPHYREFAFVPAPGRDGIEGIGFSRAGEGAVVERSVVGPLALPASLFERDAPTIWYSPIDPGGGPVGPSIQAAVPIRDVTAGAGAPVLGILTIRLDLAPMLDRLGHVPRILAFVADDTGRFLRHPFDASGRTRPRRLRDDPAIGDWAQTRLDDPAIDASDFENVGVRLGDPRNLPGEYNFYFAEAKLPVPAKIKDNPAEVREFWGRVDGKVAELADASPGVRFGYAADTRLIRLASDRPGPLEEVIAGLNRAYGSQGIAWRRDWDGDRNNLIECEKFGLHLVKLPLDPDQPGRYLALATGASEDEIVADIYEAEGKIVWAKLAVTSVAAALALLAAWLMITRPLDRITKGTVRIARGDHDVELPVRSRSEIGVLARSFQRMVEQLRERSAELKERETRLRTVLDTAAEGIVGIDERGRVEGFNQAAERITGWSAAEIQGKPYEILLGRDAKPRDGAIDQEASSSSALPIGKLGSSTRETVGFRKDGSPYPMEVSVSEVHVGGRRLWTWILRDISERKRAEVEIRQLNDDLERRVRHRTAELSRVNEDLEAARIAAESANYRKSEFLATMSHELRTPLNAVIGYGEMLDEEPGAVAEEFRPDVRKIVGSGRHLLTLINDILDLSKLEAGKVELVAETFDVAKLIDDVVSTVEPLVKKNGNALAVRVDPAAGAMHTDKTRVRQVLFNLLSNACKFTKQGTIGLEVSRIRLDAGDRLSIDVADSGIGMKPAVLAELFAPFRQADASISKDFGGTGLGLSITRKLCRLMGGDVSVASEFGKGSTFSVDLPTTLPAPTEATTEPDTDDGAELVTAGDPNGGAPTVLVIDDDPVVRDLMRRQLSKEGYVVVTATTGEEGLRVARESRPDAVTLDVLLPGMDGWEVLSQFKADPHLADVPVIMLTMLDDSNMGFALGATDYLSKPIDRAQLARLLAKLREETVGRSVLVVEDDEATRDLLRRALERIGWQVDEAENGRKGLERVARSRPSLILLDLMMPEVDGFEFVSRLRKNPDWRSIPVVVLTAMDVTPEERDRLNGGVEQILQKGHFDRDRLMREVCDLVGARASRRPVASQAVGP